jgi:aspartyl-tRNA(Asn)/glutamyl-tRNA(Gln) amidotransferase subunit A
LDIRKKTALAIGALIREKQISCVEAVTAFLDAAEEDFSKAKDDPEKTGAFTGVMREEALASAKRVQGSIDAGEAAGPLAGVPIGVKDAICTTEGETTAASKILTGYRSPFDAHVVERLKEAGAVVFAKTNTDEFTMGGSTETSYVGVARNPWDLSKVPGGSSGGSAVAVSGELAPVALGSDTGGSIRQPCSFCGLTGLKPTYGGVSRYGLLAHGSSLDTIGAIARDAADVAAVMQIISGRDERDSTSVLEKPFDLADIVSGKASSSAKGLRIGIPSNYFEMPGLADDVKREVLRASEEFRALGAEVREFELPMIDYAVPTYMIISSAEASSNLSRYDGVKYGYRSPEAEDIHDVYYRSRSEGFGAEVKRRIILGSFVLSSGYFDAYYKKALKVRYLIREAFLTALREFDAILSPVSPTVAYDIGGKIDDPVAMYLGDVFTTSINLTGLPSLSLPCGFGDEGLPIGMQLIGGAWSEPTLFSAAAAYQSFTDYHLKRPGMCTDRSAGEVERN